MAVGARPAHTTPSSGTVKAARVLVAVLMVVCFALRYYAATTVPMPYDEAQLVRLSERIVLTPGAVSLPVHVYPHRHLAGQLYLGKLGTLLLGHNLVGFRFMSVVLGTASSWIIFALVRRAWGFWPALLSLVLLCFNGFHIGVSRFAIERTYLFFSVLGIYLFWRALQDDRPGFMIAAGAGLGAGALVSEHTLLLLPVLAAYLALSKSNRRWLTRWQTWAGVLAAVAVCVPLVYMYLRNPDPQSSLYDDYGDHVERLGRFGLGYGSLALYIAPLYYKLSDRISVYPVMSLVSGALLLGAVLRAHFGAKDELTRLLLVIFWAFVGGFSLFASSRPEFKWAATSMFAAVPLAGRLLWESWVRSTLYGALSCLPLVCIAGFGIWVASASHNCYYSPLIRPAQERITDQALKHGLYTVMWEDYNFADLTGSPFFPARYKEYYFHRYITYAYYYASDDIKLARLLLERAAQIHPDHPRVGHLMKLLGQRSDP